MRGGTLALSPPFFRGGVLAVWLRNARVWRRSWKSSLVASVGEPLFYFLGLGYGLNTLVPSVGGEPYLNYVVPGLMLTSTMYSTTVEATYGSFTKMEHQKIYAAMLLAPLSFGEVVAGELLWAVTKGCLSGGTVLLLALAAGLAPPWPGAFSFSVVFFTGIVFAALGWIVTSFARGYESFNYYFTLAISPMFFFSGVFFPVERMGGWVGTVSWFSPLTHLAVLSRALFRGNVGADLLPHVLWLALFTPLALWGALRLSARRFNDG